MDTVKAFNEFISSANTGQVFTYHTGFLTMDRGTVIDMGNDGFRIIAPVGNIDCLAKLAWAGFTEGKLHLFQRKIHDNVYEYIAMKRSRYGRNW